MKLDKYLIHVSFAPRADGPVARNSKKTAMMSQSIRALLVTGVMILVLAGCGATRSSPDNPLGADGLTPNVQDKEAGLVAIAPGFDVKSYPIVAVGTFSVADSEIKDDGDRRFAAKMATYFRIELVRRLRDSGLFQRVDEVSGAEYRPTAGEKVLKLDGTITRLGRGSQAARYFAGIYGAGRARAQADMRLVEASSGKVVLATADRRVASMGFFGGSDEEHLEESFNDMARDLARFLVRLSKGEAPTKQ